MDHLTIKNQPNDFPQQYLFTGLFTQLSSSPSGKILVLPDSQSPLVCTYNHTCVYYEHWYLNKYNCNPALEVLERQVHKIQTLKATLGVCMRCNRQSTSVWWPKSYRLSTGCASGSQLDPCFSPHTCPSPSPIQIFSFGIKKRCDSDTAVEVEASKW